MADFDAVAGTFTVPWWGAAALAALIVALLVLAILRAGGGRAVTVLAQIGALAVVVFGGWTILDRVERRDRADERRALETRVADLAARAMMPGSALGCLDPLTADALDEACEKAIFNNAENLAAATAYVSARMSLLADALDHEAGNPGALDHTIAALRRPLERDRYGIVAHVLAVRDGCNVDQCEALGLLGDTTRIVANLRGHEFENRIAKANATASIRQPQTPAAPALAAAPPAPVAGSTLAFPSASSIPAVSIMNNEPGASGQNGMEEAKAATVETKPAPKPAAPAKRQADKPADKPAAPRGSQSQNQNQAPMPIAPARADAANRVQ